MTKQEFKLLQEELRHLNESQGDPFRTAVLFFVINRMQLQRNDAVWRHEPWLQPFQPERSRSSSSGRHVKH